MGLTGCCAAFLTVLIFVVCQKAVASTWLDDCVFKPNPVNASSAVCEFDSSETYIKPSMPSTLKSLHVIRGKHVYFEDGSLAGFGHLRTIYITGVKHFNMRRNILPHTKHRNGISLTLEHVNNVRLFPGVLSDWQGAGSTISMKNIDSVYFSKQALAPNSSFKAVAFENVPALYMEDAAIEANVGHLKLQNVSLKTCASTAFGGHIERMSLTSVTIGDVREGCIIGKRGWKSLSLRSSHLGHIVTSGIQGVIEDVQIEDCVMDSVAHRGLDLEVSRFSLSSSRIGSLDKSALQVRANLSISLHSLRISKLLRNALIGLKITGAKDQKGSGGQQPQMCISALTVDASQRDVLQLDRDSPVSLYGRVCRPGAGGTPGHTQCIGVNREALVSKEVFRSRCCFENVSNRVPLCPTYEWVPYMAAAVGMVLIVAVALLCYRRKLRAKRWQVVRSEERPRVSMVPSVEGLENDFSKRGSPICVVRVGGHDKKGGPDGTENAVEETEELGTAEDTGPLASWLQTVRETVSRYGENDSAGDLKMLECGASDSQGAYGVDAYEEGTYSECRTVVVTGAEVGSDTESVFHEGSQLSECAENSERTEEKTSTKVKPPEDHEKMEACASDSEDTAERPWEQDQDSQNQSKKTKKKSAPTRPRDDSVAGPGRRAEPKEAMPVNAVVERKRLPRNNQQPDGLARSKEPLVDLPSSSHNPSDNDCNAARTCRSTTLGGMRSDVGRGRPDLVYASVVKSLPRVPTVDPDVRHQRPLVADSGLYTDVYHSLNLAKTCGAGVDKNMKTSTPDHSRRESSSSACSSHLYGSISDYSPIVKQNNDLKKAETTKNNSRKTHFSATMFKKTTNPKIRTGSKTLGRFASKPFSWKS